MPFINCEINLILTWSQNCVLTSKATRDANPDADPAVTAINNPTNAIFKITDTKFRMFQLSLYQLKMIKYSKNN